MQKTTAQREAVEGVRIITIGVDVGDLYTHLCLLDGEGTVVAEERLRTKTAAFQERFAQLAPARVVLEVGTHSPWIDRLLRRLGHEVIVANPGRVRLIAQGQRKHDRGDAEQLARLGRIDPQLLSPIRHRGEEAQHDLARIRARESLVRTRTDLVNHVRGTVKSFGARLPSCSTPAFPRKAAPHLPEPLRPVLEPHLTLIEELSRRIADADREIEHLCTEQYPETRLLRQVPGVGPLTALTYVLTIEEPERFAKSRDVGAYLGLVPRQRESGSQHPELGISKAGDRLLRRLLVGAAYYILGPFGPDTDLRRWGLRHAPPGSRSAKKRAVVGVARKLAVLLHRLWTAGEVYHPLYAEAV